MIGPFIGRAHELSVAAGALGHIASGRGEVLLAVGEPGIGKTSLADAVAREAARRGLRVAWARCWEGEGAPAYWPWLQALESLGETLPAPPGVTADAGSARFAMFASVMGLLVASARQAPLLLVFDDLHVADVASLLLLQFVARGIWSHPIGLVGTYRDVDARLTPESMRLLATIGREGTYLPLHRFRDDEIATFAERLGVAVSGAQLAELTRVTEGNPLFVDHVVRGLPRSGIPPTLRAALRDRLAQVADDAARELLAVTAVAGREAAISTVARVAGLTASLVSERLAPAIAAGVVDPVDEAAHPTARFSHALLRDEMYAALPASRRAELHAALAEALEAPDAVANHALAGVAVLGAERATVAVLAAARELSTLAFEDAAALLERAIERLQALVDPARLCDLLTAWGLALIRAGDLDGGKRACSRAAGLARGLADTPRLAEAALTHGSEFTPSLVDPELVELLEESHRVLPESARALRARVLARLAAALQPAQDPSVPVSMAREAIRISGELDEADRRAVLHSASSALIDRGAPGECLAIDTELCRLARRAGDRVQQLRAHGRLVFDHMEAGDVPGADSQLEAFAELLGDLPLTRYRWQLPMMRGMRALFDGRLDDVDRLHEEARAFEGDANLSIALANQRIHRLVAEGRLDEAAAGVAVFAPMAARAPRTALVVRCVLAWIRSRSGDRAATLVEVEELRRIQAPLHDPVVAKLAAEPFALVGSPEERALLHGALAPYAGGLVSFGLSAMVVAGPVTRLLELLSAETAAPVAPAARAVRARSRPHFTLRPDGDCFRLESDGVTATLKATQGLELLARIVEQPAQDFHVLMLMPGDPGDAGAALDAPAIEAYRARAESLKDELDEAERFADLARAAKKRSELERIGAELARGVGLGGRARRVASGVERARINVQRHVRKAIRAVSEHFPALGRHLERSVKTGIHCRYDPE